VYALSDVPDDAIDWTWKSNFILSSGAVHVLAVAPARPPAKNMLHNKPPLKDTTMSNAARILRHISEHDIRPPAAEVHVTALTTPAHSFPLQQLCRNG
jgi:hypothetical protein